MARWGCRRTRLKPTRSAVIGSTAETAERRQSPIGGSGVPGITKTGDRRSHALARPTLRRCGATSGSARRTRQPRPLKPSNELAGLYANLNEPSNGLGATRDVPLHPSPVVDLPQPIVSYPHVELFAVIGGLATHPRLRPMYCIVHIEGILHFDEPAKPFSPYPRLFP